MGTKNNNQDSGDLGHDESAGGKVAKSAAEAESKTAQDIKDAKEADVEKPTGERTPANVIEKGTEGNRQALADYRGQPGRRPQRG